MDPVLLGGLFGGAVSLVSYFVGKYVERKRCIADPNTWQALELRTLDAEAARREAERSANRHSTQVQAWEHAHKDWETTYKKCAAERAKFEEIAKQHMVQWPATIDKSEEVTTKVKSLLYRSNIDANFKALEEDLAEYEGKQITIAATVTGSEGYWGLKLKPFKDSTAWKDRVVKGTPERAIREMKEGLSSAQWSDGKFIFLGEAKQFQWSSELDVITFVFTVYTREPADSATKPQVVLVPQLSTKTEIVEVQVPVFTDREVVREIVREPTDAEIEAIIAARVEVERVGMTPVSRKNTPLPKEQL